MRACLLPFFSLMFFSSCQNGLKEAPPCLQQKIPGFQAWCCIDEYQFQGKPVYTFDPGNCGGDFPTYVLDAPCDTLGFLGGFAGFTDIQGIPFYGNASFQRTLWKN
jgi:hypothetical protein